MTNNINTLSAMIAEADRIAAAHKAQPAPKHVQAMHDLHENAKQALSRDEYAALWEHIKPANSGVKDFAGKGWRRNHPDAPASPMPKAITEAQEKRKAEKAAQPKAEKKPAAKAPAKPKAPAKDKQPTQREMLANLLVSVNAIDRRLDSMDKRLTAIEKKLTK